MKGYIPYASARATQPEQLGLAIGRIADQLTSLEAGGDLRGPGPIFVGIGASFAAANAAVWQLRSRGIHSWRLGAGDLPLPYPASVHPVIGISQSGRSAETLAVLESLPEELRYTVVNTAPSPLAGVTPRVVGLGNIPDSYASTIGYTATIAALGMIADVWDGGEIDPGWATLADEVAATEERLAPQLAELAALFAESTYADFVGTGPAAGSAEAGALLFREVARIPSTGMGTRQYLHGSMESAGNGVHVLFGDGRELETAGALAAAGHSVILVSSEDIPKTDSQHSVWLPARPAAQRAILEAIVLQALVGVVAGVRQVDIEEFVFENSDTKVDHPVAEPS